MMTLKAYDRNPHVLRKLVRFTGFIPANLIGADGKLIAPAKIPSQECEELLKAKGTNRQFDIDLEGKKYHTQISNIHMDEVADEIDEINLAVIS